MWIEIDSDATKRLTIPEIDDTVEFSANNKAQVPQSVGEQPIEHVDEIQEVDT